MVEKMTGRFKDELAFQRWLVERLNVQRWHAQLMPESIQHPGIPDLNAAHYVGLELWAEVKYARKPQDIARVDGLDLPRELTAQQRSWLMSRDRWSGAMTKCGVLVGWCTRADEYVTFCPIGVWDEWQRNSVMAWGLWKYTISLRHLESGRADFFALVTEGFPPGSLPER